MELYTLISEICCLYVLVALLVAAAGKSLRFSRFHEDLMRSFPSFGSPGALVAAALILSAEWLAAGLLLGDASAQQVGLVIAFMLLAIFTAVLSWSLIRDSPVVCSCFGSSGHRVSSYDVARNTLLLTAAGFALARPQKAMSLDWSSSISLAGAALILFMLSTSWEDIALLARIKTDE